MDEENIDKLCDELTPIYFYFHLLNIAEDEIHIKDKIKHLETIRDLKDKCDKSLTNIRNILHGDV